MIRLLLLWDRDWRQEPRVQVYRKRDVKPGEFGVCGRIGAAIVMLVRRVRP